MAVGAPLKLGSNTSIPVSTGVAAQKPFDLSTFLPALGGIGGSLIGAAGGTALEPGGGTIAGGSIGGGIGQALGKFFEDLIQGKNVDVGDLFREGAVGSIFGAIPGGTETEAVGDTVKAGLDAGGETAAKVAADRSGMTMLDKVLEASTGKVGTRALTGAGLGLGTQAAYQFDPNKPGLGFDPKNLAIASALGGVSNVAGGATFDFLGKLGKHLGQQLPEDIKKAVGDRQADLKGSWVGAAGADLATEKGVIPENVETINAQDLEESLNGTNPDIAAQRLQTDPKSFNSKGINNVLEDSSKQHKQLLLDLEKQGVSTRELREKYIKRIMPTFRNATPEEIESVMGDRNWEAKARAEYDTANADAQAAREAAGALGGSNTYKENLRKRYGETTAPMSTDELAANHFLDHSASQNKGLQAFSAVTSADYKHYLSPKWSRGGNLVRKLYNNFKTAEEELSGKPNEVESSNKTLQKLLGIKSTIEDNVEQSRSGKLPERFGLTPDISLYKNKNLKTITGLINGLVSAIGYMSPMHFMGYILAKGFEPAIDKAILTPKFADDLTNAYNALSKPERQRVIKGVFTQLGVRIGTSK